MASPEVVVFYLLGVIYLALFLIAAVQSYRLYTHGMKNKAVVQLTTQQAFHVLLALCFIRGC